MWLKERNRCPLCNNIVQSNMVNLIECTICKNRIKYVNIFSKKL